MAYATKGYGSVDVAIAKESDGIRASVSVLGAWTRRQAPCTQAGPRPTRPQALVAKANSHAQFMVACNACGWAMAVLAKLLQLPDCAACTMIDWHYWGGGSTIRKSIVRRVLSSVRLKSRGGDA